MSTRRMLIVGLIALSLGVATVASAQDHGTKDEATVMANAAFEHVKKVGPERAFKDFMEDKAKWIRKDLYVFAIDMQGQCYAHGGNPKMAGRNLSEMKDANGTMLVLEMIKVAKSKGDGWVDYLWSHPQTNKISPKSTYVKKLANYDGFIGVGIYK